MANEKKDEGSKWHEAVVVLLLRICDAGYVGWVLVAIFVLGFVFLFTRNLDSKDTLALIQGIGTIHGLAWIGWIVALAEIPLMRILLDRSKRQGSGRIQRLEEENENARNLLKKYKQQELELENDK